ncbi:DUF3310 domain-containing protein [Vibrio alginolyticus]|nr:DUF3310 domain-containing protein [Vibrio alginolyticus]
MIYTAKELAHQKLVRVGTVLVCRSEDALIAAPNEEVVVLEVKPHGLIILSSKGSHFAGATKFSISHAPASDGSASTESDPVHSPSHYQVIQGVEAKDIIQPALDSLAGKLTPWQAYCLGNVLKYRLRAGDKDDLQQDINKARKYKEMAIRTEMN